ncbi:MAG: hypothetical protein V4612_04270 [Pseudomonadota bacterium]
MNNYRIENFSSQIDQIIKKCGSVLSKETAALISKNNAIGRLFSGGTLEQQMELIEKNFISAVDDCLEFTLRYADEEGIISEALITMTLEALQKFQDLAWNDFESSVVIKKMNSAGIRKIVEEKQAAINEDLNTKIRNAHGGRVNGRKLYTGNITSSNLVLFNNLCLQHDRVIHDKAGHLKKRFEALHPLLASDNPSHWANAVHECRKIFQELADELFPAQSESRKKNGLEIKLDSNAYINRLACFVEDNSKSKTYTSVVSSQLDDFGKKLKTIFDATNKGTHADLTREHAYSFAAYTYLIVGDILSLR